MTHFDIEVMVKFAKAMRENGIMVLNTPQISLQLDPTFGVAEQAKDTQQRDDLDPKLCMKCQAADPDSTMMRGLCRACANDAIRRSVNGE